MECSVNGSCDCKNPENSWIVFLLLSLQRPFSQARGTRDTGSTSACQSFRVFPRHTGHEAAELGSPVAVQALAALTDLLTSVSIVNRVQLCPQCKESRRSQQRQYLLADKLNHAGLTENQTLIG